MVLQSRIGCGRTPLPCLARAGGNRHRARARDDAGAGNVSACAAASDDDRRHPTVPELLSPAEHPPARRVHGRRGEDFAEVRGRDDQIGPRYWGADHVGAGGGTCTTDRRRAIGSRRSTSAGVRRPGREPLATSWRGTVPPCHRSHAGDPCRVDQRARPRAGTLAIRRTESDRDRELPRSQPVRRSSRRPR